jgi:diguanylate cyclase (GGDEF)-like protein/PAS domain S-box-containing protein
LGYMPVPLRVLILEDRPHNAELLLQELGRAGFQADGICVSSEAEYLAHLRPGLGLIVITDTVSGFDAKRAILLLKDRGLETPFIVVGHNGDGKGSSTEFVKLGASAYVPMDDLAALGSTVSHALEEKRFHDEMKLVAEGLRSSDQYAPSIIECSLDMIVTTDVYRRIVEFNPAAERTFGYRREEVLGKRVRMLYASSQEFNKIGAGMRERGHYVGEISNRRKNGEIFASYLSATVLKGANGKVFGVVGVSRDITEQKRIEEELRYLSMHDSLTGLFNRAYFEGEMARLEKSRKYPVSIIMADIDDMKSTNDRMGHAAGDELLRRVGSIMRAAFRTEDVVARFGGDELAVLLPDTNAAMAESAVERVRSSLAASEPALPEITLSLSFGFATAEQRMPLAEVLKRADERMYEDKARKKGYFS